MDVDYFFLMRTSFIGIFYDTAVKPFYEVQRLIEQEEEPYVPPYSDNGEPPFLEEWIEAETAIQLVGRSAISMLSDALKLYFIEWEKLLGCSCSEEVKKRFDKGGYWNGYLACFGKRFGIDWDECPAALKVLEQVALARNSSQHLESLTSFSALHSKNIRSKFPNPFFIHEHVRTAPDERGDLLIEWWGSELMISRESLLEAIEQADRFVAWLEPKLQR